jgi:hypothetical protein
MSSVREFGRAMTAPLGAPSGRVSTFIEVPFLLAEKRCYPDGLIRVSRGAKSWTCLVEVKTGTNELQAPQLENYLDIAKEQGFDALLTISNQIPSAAGVHPTAVDKRKLKKVALHHLSWSEVLSAAVMQKVHRGVADPDQAWILGELIRYLEHPRSGALEFDDMGSAWVAVRDAVAAGTLRATDKNAPEVAASFDALLRFVSLRLGRQLGTEVTPLVSRKDAADPTGRLQAQVQELVAHGTLGGSIKIPDMVAPLAVSLDLRSGRITCHVDVDAPKDGRSSTRVNWLLRQLKEAPEGLRVEAYAAFARGASTAGLLRDLRANPALLLVDPKKDLRTFRLALASPLGPMRSRGRGGAIDSVLTAVDRYYADVLSHLRAWSAPPPKLRDEAAATEPAEPVETALISSAISSQDGPEEQDGDSATDAPPQWESPAVPAVPNDDSPTAWQGTGGTPTAEAPAL